MNFDLLIVGAGPVGSIVAREAAEQGLLVLVIDRRDHLAGNCHDSLYADTNILIHNYGPHYFRANDKALFDYLSRFTDWTQGHYIVQSSIAGKLYPFPINLDTLELFFNRSFDAESAALFLEEKRFKIDIPNNSEELVLSRVGEELYNSFYLNYNIKQWGRHPRELLPSVAGRIPVRLNRIRTYVDHQYQVLPKAGYTEMFKEMLTHKNIHLRLGENFSHEKFYKHKPKATLYTGALDEYFSYSLGKLPWRSLRFDWNKLDREYFQNSVQINYPNDFDYTRIVEIKHASNQVSKSTVICYEYPTDEGPPFYPIPTTSSHQLYGKYQQKAEEENIKHNIFFAGRLADYRYMNMDEAFIRGLEISKKLIQRVKQ